MPIITSNTSSTVCMAPPCEHSVSVRIDQAFITITEFRTLKEAEEIARDALRTRGLPVRICREKHTISELT